MQELLISIQFKKGNIFMFNKVVVVDNTGMNEWAKNRLRKLSKSAFFYDDFPIEPHIIKERIGDADCLMVSYCTPITRDIIQSCPNLKYIGMCCSLYSAESSNVDILCCEERGIAVTGIFDYGDQGVVEFGISALTFLLHGFGGKMWKARPNELYGQRIGILGLGNTGFKLAKALQYFGACICYADLRKREDADALGMKHMPLHEMLKEVDILTTQLPRGCSLMNEEEFKIFGSGKILLNTSIGATFDLPAMKEWLKDSGNFYICEQVGVGDLYDELKGYDNFICFEGCAGSSEQCTQRLSEKSIANVEKFLGLEP